MSFLSQGIYVHRLPSPFIIVVLSVLKHDVPHDRNGTVLMNMTFITHSLSFSNLSLKALPLSLRKRCPLAPHLPFPSVARETGQGTGIPRALGVYILLLSYCYQAEGFLLVMSQVPFFLCMPQVHPLAVFSGAGDEKLRMCSLPNGVIFSFIVPALAMISNQIVGHFDPFLLNFLFL